MSSPTPDLWLQMQVLNIFCIVLNKISSWALMSVCCWSVLSRPWMGFFLSTRKEKQYHSMRLFLDCLNPLLLKAASFIRALSIKFTIYLQQKSRRTVCTDFVHIQKDSFVIHIFRKCAVLRELPTSRADEKLCPLHHLIAHLYYNVTIF